MLAGHAVRNGLVMVMVCRWGSGSRLSENLPVQETNNFTLGDRVRLRKKERRGYHPHSLLPFILHPRTRYAAWFFQVRFAARQEEDSFRGPRHSKQSRCATLSAPIFSPTVRVSDRLSSQSRESAVLLLLGGGCCGQRYDMQGRQSGSSPGLSLCCTLAKVVVIPRLPQGHEAASVFVCNMAAFIIGDWA